MRCYCCSNLPFSACCEPFLTHKKVPDTAEKLMRSRFSAYATKNFDYVLRTYTADKQANLSINTLAENAEATIWFALRIDDTNNIPLTSNATDTVTFSAFYFENKNIFQLHETSNFVVEDNQWRYRDGILHDDCGKIKYGRNLPCLCNSQKKFKQCCANKAR